MSKTRKTPQPVKQIRIRPSRTFKKFAAREQSMDMRAWTKAPPFVVNPRGVLVHRVRHVTTYLRGGKESHHAIQYLCGNCCTAELETISEVLVSDPPRDRLLCSFCEVRAGLFSLPTGDELAGRHVHRGVMVPRRVCCGGEFPEA